MKRVLILVEGQTEERFVKDVLAPFFYEKELSVVPTLLVTKKVKSGPDFKGGVTNFGKIKNDFHRLLNDRDALVTTLIDYYGLPNDFPGMNTRHGGTSLQRVEHVEQALADHFGNIQNFLPFLMLHEFEAWLFSSENHLPRIMAVQDAKKKEFSAVVADFNTPEDINESPESAPSKRIVKLFPEYRKTLHGPLTIGSIGLESIRDRCPHFSWWLSELEKYAAA